MNLPGPRQLLIGTLAIGVVLTGIVGATLLHLRTELHEEIRRTVIGRDSAVLAPAVRQQLATAPADAPPDVNQLLGAILPTAQQEGTLAAALFDANGNLLRAVPSSLLFAELSLTDFFALQSGAPFSRYHADFPLDRHFAGAVPGTRAPVLEVLLPLDAGPARARVGYAQFYLDARVLAGELAGIEQRLHRQTWVSIGSGGLAVAFVLSIAYLGLARAQRAIAERNERLARTNFELTLAAKASALGQITSHLIHGLQGSVTGLREAVSRRSPDDADWQTAQEHATRLQTLITEVVTLLADARIGARYEFSPQEFAAILRQRGESIAASRHLHFQLDGEPAHPVNSHTASLLTLIVDNLLQNAAAASPRHASIHLGLNATPTRLDLTITDGGGGIPSNVQARLFSPGASGRLGGTGLGLAISRLLARQLGGDLELVSTSPLGTVFRISVPQPQPMLAPV